MNIPLSCIKKLTHITFSYFIIMATYHLDKKNERLLSANNRVQTVICILKKNIDKYSYVLEVLAPVLSDIVLEYDSEIVNVKTHNSTFQSMKVFNIEDDLCFLVRNKQITHVYFKENLICKYTKFTQRVSQEYQNYELLCFFNYYMSITYGINNFFDIKNTSYSTQYFREYDDKTKKHTNTYCILNPQRKQCSTREIIDKNAFENIIHVFKLLIDKLELHVKTEI